MGFFSHKAAAMCQPGELQDHLATADRPVLVEFGERDSPACQIEAPILEQVAHRYEGRLVVFKVDVTTLTEDAARFKVRAVPTILLIVNGEERLRLVGFQSIDDLTRAVDAALPSPSAPPT